MSAKPQEKQPQVKKALPPNRQAVPTATSYYHTSICRSSSYLVAVVGAGVTGAVAAGGAGAVVGVAVGGDRRRWSRVVEIIGS